MNDAVLAVPAHVNDSQRQATATRKLLHGSTRSVSVTSSQQLQLYMAQTKEGLGERNVLTYDMGEGTCGVSLLPLKMASLK